MAEALQQEQFLEVIDRDEAERRFRRVLDLRPLEAEEVPLAEALGRILATDVTAPIDVPGFDRSNVDGFAIRAEDSFGASEDRPRTLEINPETLATGVVPRLPVRPGIATPIATGAMLPRGADAVVMIEHTEVIAGVLHLRRPAAPGANISFAGTDIGRGETVLRRGERLTARETGVLAALGLERVRVIRRPRVAILSTGDEIVAPGAPMRPGLVYDSNATILADAVREIGGQPLPLGIIPDDRDRLDQALRQAVAASDVVLLSGGTSKGAGDLSYRVVGGLGPPGIVAHGVALKPGKPLCLAAVFRPKPASPAAAEGTGRPVPIAILPGFPTSAIFTFQEFVAPIIRRLAGQRDEPRSVIEARLPMRVNSERGRTEYLLVNLIASGGGDQPRRLHSDWVAFPMGKGSGSVTTFSRADGFLVIPRQREYLEAGETVTVHLLGEGLEPADLVVIGSHCTGLDFLLGRLHERGWRCKFLAVGSSGGLDAARRGECDLAGIHLLDPATHTYNRPFLTPELELIPGYGRLQGILFRPGDPRWQGRKLDEALPAVLADPDCVMVNRNRGSGTRVLIDRLLQGARPSGYLVEARAHNSVAAAIAQGRADWGVAIETVARDANLGFLPLQEERYDFVVPRSRWERPVLAAFRQVLEESRPALRALGFR
jgi:putative molybdopterin biosynthesis protein